MNAKWDHRFLELAKLVATWSKDPSTQVGAVIADDRRIILGLGYNGFPRGVVDHPSRYTDREIKYEMVQHAETNAIANASAPVLGATCYVTAMPCARCMGHMIQHGIARVVALRPTDSLRQRFEKSFSIAEGMADEAGVEIETID